MPLKYWPRSPLRFTARLAALELGKPCPQSVTLVRCLAEGLAVAHKSGITHRDIKPSNIYLRNHDPADAVLMDFGIARRGRQLRTLTQTGIVIGTPEYMAPEQARALREIGPEADIFSLGCVLYECLAGRPPFFAEHMVAVIAKILFEDAPLLLYTGHLPVPPPAAKPREPPPRRAFLTRGNTPDKPTCPMY